MPDRQDVVMSRVARAINAHRRLIGAENALDRARKELTEVTTGLNSAEIAEYMERTERALRAAGRGGSDDNRQAGETSPIGS